MAGLERVVSRDAFSYIRIVREYLRDETVNLLAAFPQADFMRILGLKGEEVLEQIGQRSRLEDVKARLVSDGLVALSVPGDKCDLKLLSYLLEKCRLAQLDFDIYPTIHSSVFIIGAPEVWNSGVTGKGVSVGILDSGVDAEHPALWVEEEFNFSWGPDDDTLGHGTHVAGILSSMDSKNRGVAHNATLLSGKVFGGPASDSVVIEGYEWLKDHNCGVVNLSLGRFTSEPAGDLLREPIRDGWRRGIVNVASAGNEGPDFGTILAPGCFEECITVGAVDNNRKLAKFSSRGPTLDGRIKPDLVAPGVSITSCRSKYSQGRGEWKIMSGTSMAAPHVSGAAAILIECCHDTGIKYESELIKNTLMASAVNLGYDPNEQGAGLINLAEAKKKLEKKPEPVSLPPSKYTAVSTNREFTPTLLSELAQIQKRYKLSSVGRIAMNCITAYGRGAGVEALKLTSFTVLASNLREELKEILKVEDKLNSQLGHRSLKKHLKNALAELEKDRQ
ncbi:MAG: S8 family serine peptidase [Candidatus Freyarchaeota archaeon]|nr:S8 family serine peptidase [Candidatus Jordarchaeia archaeon]MBS7270513.1 S8 family serine peptidase [Candidatus Jordarchaeia archaeon]